MISSLGFMDDANWISGSLSDLEQILNVTDEFYDITRIAINKDKSKLLMNTTQDDAPLPIQFGKNRILIMPTIGSVRFLDMSININMKHALVIKELRSHIKQFIRLVKSKSSTDKQYC